MSSTVTTYYADVDATGALIGKGLYVSGLDPTIPTTAVAITQEQHDRWMRQPGGLLLLSGNLMLVPSPPPTAQQLFNAAAARLQAYVGAIYAKGVLFQTAAMGAASPAQPAVAFPLTPAGRQNIGEAQQSASQTPSLWTDGHVITDVTGKPWPFSNADVMNLAKKASPYFQSVSTFAAQQLAALETNPAHDFTTAAWPSNA